MPRNPVIRPGTASDIQWVLEQLREFSKFYGTKASLFGDEEHGRKLIMNVMVNHIFLVAEREGELLGFISGFVGPHPFNPSIHLLTEVWWWVAKAARGSRAGLMLLNAFVEWGRANADWITFALERNSPVNESVLADRGFVLQERNFLMEVS